jgi:hypothetical protein
MTIMIVEVAGGLLTPESIETPTSTKKLVGSTFIFQGRSISFCLSCPTHLLILTDKLITYCIDIAPNIQAVKDWIESDLYYTSNVVSSNSRLAVKH